MAHRRAGGRGGENTEVTDNFASLIFGVPESLLSMDKFFLEQRPRNFYAACTQTTSGESSRATKFTSSAGSPLTASCKKLRWNCSVPTGTPSTPIPYRTPVSPVVSIATRCSYATCSRPTPSASRTFEFLRFSEMLSTPRRSCSHSITFPIAAISRESSGGRMTVMSSMNETALAPGTGGLALNYFLSLSLCVCVCECVCVCVCVCVYLLNCT